MSYRHNFLVIYIYIHIYIYIYIYSTSDFILSRANIFIYASDGDVNSKLMSPGLTGFKFVVKFRTIQTQWRC